MTNETYKIAAVHGRFQPLHKGHIEYILEAKKRCDFLWVGITQFNISSLVATPNDPHRQVLTSNPLTYFERVEIITSSLVDEGILQKDFSCIPFPIETPEYLINFLPVSTPMFTTICDDWNKHKISLLVEKGYKVEVLFNRDKKSYEGTEIRRSILNGDDLWKEMVSKKTMEFLLKINIYERLRHLQELQNQI